MARTQSLSKAPRATTKRACVLFPQRLPHRLCFVPLTFGPHFTLAPSTCPPPHPHTCSLRQLHMFLFPPSFWFSRAVNVGEANFDISLSQVADVIYARQTRINVSAHHSTHTHAHTHAHTRAHTHAHKCVQCNSCVHSPPPYVLLALCCFAGGDDEPRVCAGGAAVHQQGGR